MPSPIVPATPPFQETIPHEIRQLRKKADEFHRQLGQAVILKHKWTEEDVDNGFATHCPYCRDTTYAQGSQADPYCFGTGYLGGFQDGVMAFMTLGDTQEDVFKLTDSGILVRDKHPICTASWYPRIQDGDLIITADWDPSYNTIHQLNDRYLAKEVTPVQPRGVYRGVPKTKRRADYIVSQNFQIDHLEKWHPYYGVQMIFTPSLPTPPSVAPGDEPDSQELFEISADITIAVEEANSQTWTFQE